MTLDVSGVEAGAKKAEAAFDGVSASAEKTGEQSERSFDAMLAPLERISKQLSQMGAHLSELTGLSRQNGVALAELGNQLSNIGTAAVKAQKGTGSAGKALKDTESDALDFAAAAVRSNQRVAELSQELQSLTDHKKALEQNGFGLGFRDYDQTVARIQELKTALKDYQASLSKPIAVRAEGLDNLTAKLKQAKADLKSLEGAGFGLGDANYDTQYQEVMRLTAAVKEYKASLAQAEQEPPRLGERLRQAGISALTLGRNLASAVGNAVQSGFRRLGSLLGNIGSRLLGVGRSAESSNQGLTRMVRSIRSISVVSLGLKLVSAMFGRLRSVVNQYLSENQAAQAAVNSLKSAFSNALAPAINIAINALSAILPYIQAVSNAFATLFTNLFGAQWTTISGGAAAVDSVTNATKGAAAAQEEYNRTLAGFDQITKLDDNSSSGSSGGGGGGGGSTSTTTGAGMLGQFSQFMEDLADMVKNGEWANLGAYLAESFGSAIDRLYDALTSTEIYAKIDSGITALGTTVNSFFARMTMIDDETGDSIAEKTGMALGSAVNLAFHTVNSTLTSINWGQIGLTLAQMINGAVEETDFSQIGTTVANWFLTLPKIAYSAVINTDWGAVASGISDAVMSALQTVNDALDKVEWDEIGQSVADFLLKIDWFGIAGQIVDLFASGLAGIGTAVVEAIKGIVPSVMDAVGDFTDKIGQSFEALKEFLGGIDLLEVIRGDFSSATDGWAEFTAKLSVIWAPDSTPEAKSKEFDRGWNAKKPNAAITPKMAQSRGTFWKSWYNAGSGWYASAAITPKFITSGASLAKSYAKTMTDGFKKNPARVYVKLPQVQYSSGSNGTLKPRATNTMYRLARGGIVNRATMFGGFEAGEDGTEAIIPLEHHTEWLDKVADRLAQRVSSSGAAGGNNRPILVQVVLDGRVVGETAVDYAIGVANTTGQLPWAAYT